MKGLQLYTLKRPRSPASTLLWLLLSVTVGCATSSRTFKSALKPEPKPAVVQQPSEIATEPTPLGSRSFC